MNLEKLFKALWFQVIVGIILGILVGYFFPTIGTKLEPLGQGFISLIKMLITPIIFGTLVVGIVGMGDLKKIGKIGIKSLIYFEVMTTFALIIGVIAAELIQPGKGLNAGVTKLNPLHIQSSNTTLTATSFILNIIPSTIFSGFVTGNILQVLLVSILFSIGLLKLKESGNIVLNLIDKVTKVFYEIVKIVTYFAPIGAFGAIGFTVGTYGIGTTEKLFSLIFTVYSTSIVFIIIGLGIIAKICGFNIFKLIIYIKNELILGLGTNSSEVVLPKIMKRLEEIGCDKSVVGFVIPTGYSFNLDGTCIYLTIATIFILQAFNIHMPIEQMLVIFSVLLITSKGAAAVSGGGFVVLSATLSIFNQIPIEALSLIFSVDLIISEARTITNIMGNTVGTIAMAKWENLLDKNKLKNELNRKNTNS
jgi:aerobic C4-dicarboxylate transport protein